MIEASDDYDKTSNNYSDVIENMYDNVDISIKKIWNRHVDISIKAIEKCDTWIF